MKQLSGQATPEQIATWKEQYGKVFTYTVDNMICYLRPVDRNVYSLATAKVATAPAKFSETIITSIWLGGDETIRKDDSYYFGLIDFVEDLMAKKKGTLETL